MKQFAAIWFLLVMVFNFYGYRMMLFYLEKKSESVLEKSLDVQAFNDAELISLKTKLNLPYYTSSAGFERAYGTICRQGVVYQYVKKRVYNDTLELLCLPNAVKTRLQAAGNELAKSTAESPASLPTKKAPATLKLTLPDFCLFAKAERSFLPLPNTNYFIQNEMFLEARLTRRLERPPQV